MNAELPSSRKRLRAERYDYAQPAGYLVTICVHGRRKLLGEITEEHASLSPAGRMVEEHWLAVAMRYPFVELDSYAVMPNHFHGIITLQPVDGEMPPKTLSQIIGAFKSMTTIAYKRAMDDEMWTPIGEHLWQRSFHDRIIRGDRHLDRLRDYVEANGANWPWDAENPDRLAALSGVH
ncbi:MAG TPA: transposase [Thermomicrobiales bacterium]|nr:transposase [Thermomicrobiales bacterium]